MQSKLPTSLIVSLLFACSHILAQRTEPFHERGEEYRPRHDGYSLDWSAGSTPQQQAAAVMRAWNLGLQNIQEAQRLRQQEDALFRQRMEDNYDRSSWLLRQQMLNSLTTESRDGREVEVAPAANRQKEAEARLARQIQENSERQAREKAEEAEKLRQFLAIEARKAETNAISKEISVSSGITTDSAIAAMSKAVDFVGEEIKGALEEKAVDAFAFEFLDRTTATVITKSLSGYGTAASFLDPTDLADGTLPDSYDIARLPPAQRRQMKIVKDKLFPTDPLQLFKRAQEEADLKFIQKKSARTIAPLK